jgi:hypothetical protein
MRLLMEASLSTASLGGPDFGSLLGAFRRIPSIFITLSLLDTRAAGSLQRVVPHK